METDRFEEVVRSLAVAPSRREAVPLLAAGFLATVGLEQATGEAAVRTSKKKKKGDVNKFCKKQVGQCETSLAEAEFCAGNPECPAVIECCAFFGSCNVSGFLACLESVLGP